MTQTVQGYRATRNTQGHLTIHEVPIFVECTRGEMCFDGKWIATAVAFHRSIATTFWVVCECPSEDIFDGNVRIRTKLSNPRLFKEPMCPKTILTFWIVPAIAIVSTCCVDNYVFSIT